LFGKKKKDEDGNGAGEEGIVGLFVAKMAAAEAEFANYVVGHLERLHEPGGYAREKQENDFMDLGMRRSYLDALDDIEFSVDQRLVYAEYGIRKRGGAQTLTHWTVRGVHNRPLLGIAPSGDQVTLTGVTFTTLRNYKIRVDYTYWEFPQLTRRMVER
jgi:hypothetical protein